MAAGFFPLHHGRENFLRIEVLVCLVEQGSRVGGKDARDETCPHGCAAGVATGRIERETDDRLTIAHDIGDDRHDRRRHLGEIEARIPDLGLQRDRAFADVDDTHVAYSNSCYSALRKRDGSVRRTSHAGSDGRQSR